jgi:hypothetical protein
MKLLLMPMLLAGLASGANHFDVFVDVSASITEAQRLSWLQSADKLADQFSPGDAATLYPVHNNTGSAGALFDQESHPLDDNMGADDQIAARGGFVRMKNGFRAALRATLLQPGRATETDIFSAFDRIRRDPAGRHIVVLIISDMLQSSPRDVDMEKTRITEQSTKVLIETVARRHRWGADTLAGVDVRCLLPPVGAEVRAQANDRLTVKFFWDAFCRSLGGKLDTFDTQL